MNHLIPTLAPLAACPSSSKPTPTGDAPNDLATLTLPDHTTPTCDPAPFTGRPLP